MMANQVVTCPSVLWRFMLRTSRFGLGAIVMLAPALGITRCASGALHYHVEMLDGLGDNTKARSPQAVNDAGDVVGVIGSVLPVRWNATSTTPTRLSKAVEYPWSVQGINSAGVVVGQSYASGLSATRWDGTAATPLGLLTFNGESIAQGVNDHGDIVGYAPLQNTTNRAVRWAPGSTTPIQLADVVPGHSSVVNSYAFDVNEKGDIVGTTQIYLGPNQFIHAVVRWSTQNDTVVQLPGTDAEPASINDLGVVVGKMGKGDGFAHAILWPTDGTEPLELPIPNDGIPNRDTLAVAINNSGDIVGFAKRLVNGKESEIPVLWSSEGTVAAFLQDLIPRDSGLVLGGVTDINNNGVIVGSGTFDPDGSGPLAAQPAAFRLIPDVPEPTGLALVGVASCLFFKRRSRFWVLAGLD
jgi:uncharacterized membrane protein